MESTGLRSGLCTVYLLNGQELQCKVERNADGLQLLRHVRESLDILEFDYFGLYFEDSAQQRYWLEPMKSIKKQLKNSPWKFYLSIKFYPSDPSQLSEDVSRYYMVLQLRENIVSGKLPCSFVTHALLGSFVVQSELGDYDPPSMRGNYVVGFQFAPNQTRELEDKVMDLHRTHKGLTPEEAEIAFLENAKKLPLYGVDQHLVKDSENIELILGVSWNGLKVFREKTMINRFAWPRILKMSYTRNKYYIKIRPVDERVAESIVGFKLSNHKSAKRLWKSCVEHHAFFRLIKPKPVNSKFVKNGSQFRYIGQTQHQTRQMVASSNRKNISKIQRTPTWLGSQEPKIQSSQNYQDLPEKKISDKEVSLIEEELTEQPEMRQPSSSSVMSSVTNTEGTDMLTKHQQRVHKMKQQNEKDPKSDVDGEFLERSQEGKGSSEWDLRLQSFSKQEEKTLKPVSNQQESEMLTGQKVNSHGQTEEDQADLHEDGEKSFLESAAIEMNSSDVLLASELPDRKRSASSSLSDEGSSEDKSTSEMKSEVIVHAEHQEKLPIAQDQSVNDNRNNNNNEQMLKVDNVTTGCVITTVATKSVRVEDILIPRDINEVHKIALAPNEENEDSISSASSESSESIEAVVQKENTLVLGGIKQPPTVETEIAIVEPTKEEIPAITRQPPLVQTETKTITYESPYEPQEITSDESKLLTSQTITAETMSAVTTTNITKTVVGTVSETRLVKSIVITTEGDTDLHETVAVAIRDTEVDNPDVSITKVVVKEEKVMENQSKDPNLTVDQ